MAAVSSCNTEGDRSSGNESPGWQPCLDLHGPDSMGEAGFSPQGPSGQAQPSGSQDQEPGAMAAVSNCNTEGDRSSGNELPGWQPRPDLHGLDSMGEAGFSPQGSSGQEQPSGSQGPLVCTACGQSFFSEKEASEHILHVHYNLAQINDEQPMSEKEIRDALREAADALGQLVCHSCGLSSQYYMYYYLHKMRCPPEEEQPHEGQGDRHKPGAEPPRGHEQRTPKPQTHSLGLTQWEPETPEPTKGREPKDPEGQEPGAKLPTGHEPRGQEQRMLRPRRRQSLGPIKQEPEAKEPEGQEAKGQEPRAERPKGHEPKGHGQRTPRPRRRQSLGPIKQEPEAKEPEGQEAKGQEPGAERPKGYEPKGHGQRTPRTLRRQPLGPRQREPKTPEPTKGWQPKRTQLKGQGSKGQGRKTPEGRGGNRPKGRKRQTQEPNTTEPRAKLLRGWEQEALERKTREHTGKQPKGKKKDTANRPRGRPSKADCNVLATPSPQLDPLARQPKRTPVYRLNLDFAEGTLLVCSACQQSSTCKDTIAKHILEVHYNLARVNDDHPLTLEEMRSALRLARFSVARFSCPEPGCGVSYAAFMSYYEHLKTCGPFQYCFKPDGKEDDKDEVFGLPRHCTRSCQAEGELQEGEECTCWTIALQRDWQGKFKGPTSGVHVDASLMDNWTQALKQTTPIACPNEGCIRLFRTSQGLRYHYPRCNINRLYRCLNCRRSTFQRPKSLLMHLKRCYPA